MCSPQNSLCLAHCLAHSRYAISWCRLIDCWCHRSQEAIPDGIACRQQSLQEAIKALTNSSSFTTHKKSSVRVPHPLPSFLSPSHLIYSLPVPLLPSLPLFLSLLLSLLINRLPAGRMRAGTRKTVKKYIAQARSRDCKELRMWWVDCLLCSLLLSRTWEGLRRRTCSIKTLKKWKNGLIKLLIVEKICSSELTDDVSRLREEKESGMD